MSAQPFTREHARVIDKPCAPRRTFALQIGDEASKLPHHQTLPEALLRAVGEAQLGETVIVLEILDVDDRLKITPLAKIGPYS